MWEVFRKKDSASLVDEGIRLFHLGQLDAALQQYPWPG
jgi:hypothetical protein